MLELSCLLPFFCCFLLSSLYLVILFLHYLFSYLIFGHYSLTSFFLISFPALYHYFSLVLFPFPNFFFSLSSRAVRTARFFRPPDFEIRHDFVGFKKSGPAQLYFRLSFPIFLSYFPPCFSFLFFVLFFLPSFPAILL